MKAASTLGDPGGHSSDFFKAPFRFGLPLILIAETNYECCQNAEKAGRTAQERNPHFYRLRKRDLAVAIRCPEATERDAKGLLDGSLRVNNSNEIREPTTSADQIEES